MNFVFTNDELCIRNDEFCIENDVFVGEVDFEEFESWWQETAKQKDSVLGSLLGGGGGVTVGSFLGTLRVKKKDLAEKEAAIDPFRRKAMALYNHPASHAPGHPSHHALMENGTNAEDDTAYKIALEEVRVDADRVRARAQKHRARIEIWAAWMQDFDIMDEAYRKDNGDPLPRAKMLVQSNDPSRAIFD